MCKVMFLAAKVICSSTKDTVAFTLIKEKVGVLNLLRTNREVYFHGLFSVQETRYTYVWLKVARINVHVKVD